jgi:hypothetical protein
MNNQAHRSTAPAPSGRTARGAEELRGIRVVSRNTGVSVKDLVALMPGYEPELHREVEAEIEAGG